MKKYIYEYEEYYEIKVSQFSHDDGKTDIDFDIFVAGRPIKYEDAEWLYDLVREEVIEKCIQQ